MRAQLVCSLALVAAWSTTTAGQRVPRPSADDVVARAAGYVVRFVDEFTSVVAEENYSQRVDWFKGDTRVLKADFMLVKIGPGAVWMPFRDVFQVNNAAVRDRDDRLVNLFLERPDEAAAQALAITAESYRFNIGFNRTVNNPLLALTLLQDLYRSRFSFELAGSDTIGKAQVWTLRFEEKARPTVIKGSGNSDLAAHGRYWIDQANGTILRTELQLDDKNQKTRILTTFESDNRFRLAVPVLMEETYVPSKGPRTIARAQYGRFRRFEVKTEEAMKPQAPQAPAK
jgi:hypothetical protein